MERLQIRKRREITRKPAHPISEAMPTLLLAMALITSPTTVITTNDRYGTASLSPTRSARFRRSSDLQPTVHVQTACVTEPALSTERSAATALQPTNPVEAECDTSPAAQPETNPPNWFTEFDGRSQEFEMEEDLLETVPVVYGNNNTAMEKDTSQESSSRQSPSPSPPPPSLRPFTAADLKTRIIHSQPQQQTSRFHLSLALSGNDNVNIDISPSPGDALTMSVTVTTNAPETV